MTKEQATAAVGQCVSHSLHGNAILLRVSRSGCRIQVWGGINGDKKYEFTVAAGDLQLGHKGAK